LNEGALTAQPQDNFATAHFTLPARSPNFSPPVNNSGGCPAVYCELAFISRRVRFPKAWWTGKDSNLRSPQGAADLQSAGFSHSPTRPAKTKRTLNACPPKLFQANPCGRKQKHKKDSCQKTPARLFFLEGFAPHSPYKSWWSW